MECWPLQRLEGFVPDNRVRSTHVGMLGHAGAKSRRQCFFLAEGAMDAHGSICEATPVGGSLSGQVTAGACLSPC